MRDSGAGLEHKVANLEPLSSVRKNFRVSWYRSPIEHRKLRELMRPNDLQGWFQAGGHMGIAVITGAAVIYFSLQGMWLAMFVGLLAHGTVCSFFKGTFCLSFEDFLYPFFEFIFCLFFECTFCPKFFIFF